LIKKGCQRLLDTLYLFLLTKKLISHDQTEQDDAQGADAVFNKKHQNHTYGYPEQDKSNESFQVLLLG